VRIPAPRHAPAPASRPRGAAVAHSRLGVLQALADGSAPAAGLRRLSAAARSGVLQLAADVYNATHFADPVAYLRGGDGDTKVVEDGGSAGMSSAFYRQAARGLANARVRASQIRKWQDAIDAIWENGTPSKPEENRSAAINEAVKALELVTDWRSAALFLRENSLRMSKGGIDLQAVRNEGGEDGGDAHTFHRDSGFVKVAASDLATTGAQGTKIAAALNGPGGKGWVQGHSEIDNYKHRFIEHVHVNKGQGDRAFEIYNGNKEDGDAALAWGTDKGALLKPEGRDAGAVNDANVARRDADLAAAELAHQQQLAAQQQAQQAPPGNG
jgi:hypothetical protein